MPIDYARLLAITAELQLAEDFDELLAATGRGVEQLTGYRSAWLFVAEDSSARIFRALAATGPTERLVWEVTPRLTVEGDAMLEEIATGKAPVVVDDARIDPRTDKTKVDIIGNRTIVNVPLLYSKGILGALGTGTFGDEGPRPPTDEDLDHLVIIAGQVAAALQRIRLQQQRLGAERERDALRTRLAAVERIESLGLLAGGVAHDFNNLLTVILGYLGFLAESPLSPEQQHDVTQALGAGERARQLTHQLLAVSRQAALVLAPIVLDQRLAAISELLRRLIPESIRIELRKGAGEERVMADAVQLDQVMMNLAVNARDAMPDGGRLLIETSQVVLDEAFVAAHPWARVGRFLLMTVSDDGVGMSRDVLEHVFEPFFTTKATGSGTGLGLAVAQGIIEQHGGFLHCYSEPGVGTTFRVYLPEYQGEASAPALVAQRPRARGHERLLVVEDDPAVRAVVVRMLENAGYTVEAVSDGTEALALAADQPFDLALLDVVMPGLSSRELFQRMRALRPNMAVLFGSGYAADALPPSFLRDNGLELVEKPYHPERLLAAVRRALGERSEPPVAADRST